MEPPPDVLATAAAPATLRFEYANENRQATISLGGTGVAILTFLLIFLYGRFSSGGPDALLFRVTLAVVVISIFLLGIAGSYYYFLIEALERKQPGSAPLLSRADACFAGGIVLLFLEPALILFTLQIDDIGLLAAGLWVVSVVIITTQRRAMSRSANRGVR
ncbi:MAG TPA: hypothetical protein VEL82_05625 [Thermoplasmata archaeon]|nr:hypothetical protein [Thermoplasmata archaeon]